MRWSGKLAGVYALAAFAACRAEPYAVPSYGDTGAGCKEGATEACYGGHAGTKGVGACRAGVRACDAYGRFGACDGEVRPAAEVCGNGVDENCDGLTSCGEAVMAARLGIGESEGVDDLAVDGKGDVAYLGFYVKPLDLGSGPLPQAGNGRAAVVGKVGPDGKPLWARAVSGKETLYPGFVAVGPAGEVAFTASFWGAVDAMGTPLASEGWDSVIGVVDADGKPRFALRAGGSEDDGADGIGFFPDGSFAVAGSFRRHFTFAGAALDAVDVDDGYVVKVGGDGKALWARDLGGSRSQWPQAFATAPDGRVAVAGSFRGDLAVGPTKEAPLAGASDRDETFVVALGKDGGALWSRAFAATACHAIAFAGDDLVLAGSFSGAVDFDAVHLEANATRAVFVARLDGAGRVRWAKRFGGPSDQDATGMAVDARGRIVLAGFYEGAIDFDGTALPPGGVLIPELFVTKLEPDGSVVWARSAKVAGDQWLWGIERGWRRVAVGPKDAIALGGYVYGPFDLGNGKTSDHGAADMLLAMLAP